MKTVTRFYFYINIPIKIYGIFSQFVFDLEAEHKRIPSINQKHRIKIVIYHKEVVKNVHIKSYTRVSFSFAIPT